MRTDRLRQTFGCLQRVTKELTENKFSLGLGRVLNSGSPDNNFSALAAWPRHEVLLFLVRIAVMSFLRACTSCEKRFASFLSLPMCHVPRMIYPQRTTRAFFPIQSTNHLEMREIMWVKEKGFEGCIVFDPLYSLTLQTIVSKQAVYQNNYILTFHNSFSWKANKLLKGNCTTLALR